MTETAREKYLSIYSRLLEEHEKAKNEHLYSMFSLDRYAFNGERDAHNDR